MSYQYRNELLITNKNILKDKEKLKNILIKNMLNKTAFMFKYKNLPDTIPSKDLELILQTNGSATFAKVNDKLYVFKGALGGEPNPYYLPTLSIIANPSLKYNASLVIDKDCVVMLNDYLYEGYLPVFNKWASLLVENEISLKQAIFNARVPSLLQADNDRARESAELFLEKIERGEDYGVIANTSFFKGIETKDYIREHHIKDLIESMQYIKSQWYNDIGIKSAFNMKREAISGAEASMNDDLLLPTIDTMLDCRQKGIDKVNAMFGTNITVERNSIWEVNKILSENVIERENAEINNIISESNNFNSEANKFNSEALEVKDEGSNDKIERDSD